MDYAEAVFLITYLIVLQTMCECQRVFTAVPSAQIYRRSMSGVLVCRRLLARGDKTMLLEIEAPPLTRGQPEASWGHLTCNPAGSAGERHHLTGLLQKHYRRTTALVLGQPLTPCCDSGWSLCLWDEGGYWVLVLSIPIEGDGQTLMDVCIQVTSYPTEIPIENPSKQYVPAIYFTARGTISLMMGSQVASVNYTDSRNLLLVFYEAWCQYESECSLVGRASCSDCLDNCVWGPTVRCVEEQATRHRGSWLKPPTSWRNVLCMGVQRFQNELHQHNLNCSSETVMMKCPWRGRRGDLSAPMGAARLEQILDIKD